MSNLSLSLLPASLLITVGFGLNLELIQGFLEYNSLNFGTVITCRNDGSIKNISRHFMSNGVFINVLYTDFNIFASDFYRTNKHFGIVLNGSCYKTEQILNASAQHRLFTERHKWLIIDPENKTLEMFKTLPIYIDAEIYLAVNCGNICGKQWSIFEIYNPSALHGGSLNVSLVGSFESGQYLIEERPSKYWRRKDLSGITFKSIIVLTRPFPGTVENYVYDDTHRDVNTWTRCNYVLTKHLQEFYNFSITLEVSKSWGYILENGSFDGLVGALERKEIDFGTSSVFFKLERARVVDYTRYTWILKSSFMFRHPKTYSALYNIYLIPLATSVWICTLFAAFLLIVFFKISTIYEWKFVKDLNDLCDKTWGYTVVMVLGIFCQQGVARNPTLFCGRILTISGLILSFMIYQFYSASIVATLLMDTPITIKTLKDLMFSSLTVGVEDVVYNRAYFNETKDPTTLKLFEKKVVKGKHLGNSSDGFYPPEVGLNLIKKGGFAFLVEHPTAFKQIDQSFPNDAICELAEVKVYQANPTLPVLQKHSPFREMLNYGLQRLAENGVLHRQRLHWTQRKPECVEKSAKSSIDIIEFSPVLELLALGMFLSILIFIGEMIHQKYLTLKELGTPEHVFPYVD